MEFHRTVLGNGLTIIAESNPQAASMAAGFFVRAGSRDETPEVAGVSHFLEHMAFKGTARRTPFDVNRDFDRLGAEYNAFTSEENTVYFGAVLPEYQTDLLDILGDILRPALRGEDFEMEKNVILDEIARYEDQPGYRVYEKLMGEFFAGHPLGNSVLGTRESIQALRQEDMQAYFDRRYSPRNVTVVGTGRIDFDAFVAKIDAMCSAWKPYDVARSTPAAAPKPLRKVLLDGKIVREHIAMMSPAPSAQDDARYAAGILATILGDDNGSRLFYALIAPAIAEEANMSHHALDGAGAFLTFLSTDPDRSGEALRIVHDVFGGFLDEGPIAAELTAAQNKIASGATLKGELPMGRLVNVGFDWVYRGQYVPLAEQIERFYAVSAADVLSLGRSCDITATTVLGLGPAEAL
jgi:predicted Zn-dependent peptidase